MQGKGWTFHLAFSLLLLFFGLLVHTSGVYSSHIRKSSICGSISCPVNKKFKYSPNYRYSYKYSVDISTVFAGIGTNASTFQFDVELDILWKSTCEGQLEIKKVNAFDGKKEKNVTKHSSESGLDESGIDESDDSINLDEDQDELSAQLQKSLSQNLLRFYFNEGHVTELCTNKEEPSWVLNIKRGILTTFQNTMKRLDLDYENIEMDVNGNCPSRYHLEYVNGTVLTISKKKNIQSCTERYQLYSVLPTSPYVFQRKYHKWTPMAGTLECKQYIDHGIYLSVSCLESHSFQPLMNQSHNAVTTISQKLQLLNEEYISEYDLDEAYVTGPIGKRVSLLFDHEKPKKLESHELHESRELLKKLCLLSQQEEFQPSFPDVYTKLIHSAKHLSYQALAQLHRTSNEICPSGKKYIQDALPYLRSIAAVTLMKDVLIQEKVSDIIFNEWLFALSIFPRPNYEVIAATVPLIRHYPENEVVLLSVTATVHSFCKWYSCEDQKNVSVIISHLNNMINNSIISETYDRKLNIMLKSIGNAGVGSLQSVKLLNKLIIGKHVPIGIKVEAIEAHRRFSCKLNQQFLLSIYLDKAVDVEVRIAAYLQLMKCPSYNILQSIRSSLRAESMNQVGSFVTSHLRNLMQSSMPNKLHFQSMLEDFQFERNFKEDIRVFSRNYENSFYLNEYGIGLFVETNVIFSPRSYIPRKIAMNVSTNIFDESISLFEVQVTLEGFERYAEYFFKPGGLLNFDDLKNSLNLLRFIRSLPNAIKEKIDSLPNIIKKNFPPPKFSVSLKMFDNELKYFVFDGESKIHNIFDSLNPLKIIKRVLDGQDIDLERTSMFLDISYVVPTGAGLPLNLNAVGTADIHLNMGGSIQAQNFTNTGKMSMQGKLKPSVAIHLEGTMGVDAFCSSTLIKIKSKMYTSTAVNATLDVNSSKHIKLSFNLPLKRSNILNAESELSVYQRNEESVIEGGQVIGEDRIENLVCSWPVLDQSLGLKLCMNYMFPNTKKLLKAPFLLFSGPVKFGIFLEKVDLTAKEYLLQYKHQSLQNQSIISLEFETPGSAVKRNIKASFNFNLGSQNISFTYKSASTELLAQGIYKNLPEEKLIHFGLDINGKKHIDIHLELKMKEEKYGYSYLPVLSFAINDKKIAELQGSYKWVEKKSISQCDINLDFKTNKFSTRIVGYIRVNEASTTATFSMEYQFDASKAETLKMVVHMGDHSSKHLTQLVVTFELESSAYPQIDFIANAKYQKAQGHFELSLNLTTSPSLKNEAEKLNAQYMLVYLDTPFGHKINTYVAVKRPISDVDTKLELTYEGSDGHWKTTVRVQYARERVIELTLELLLPKITPLHLEFRSSLNLPQVLQPMSMFLRIHGKSAGEYDLEISGSWFSGHNITAKGVYLNKSTYLTTHLIMKVIIKSAMFNDIIFNGKLLLNEGESRFDLQAEHNDIKYAILLKHLVVQPAIHETSGELDFGESSYTVTNIIDFVKKEIVLEIHLDKHRDIHLGVHGIHEKEKTDAGFYIKWDANRDPNQKLAFTLLTNSVYSVDVFDYSGKLLLEYPSHVITASILLEQRGTNYLSTVTIEWSPQQSVDLMLMLNYDFPNNGKIFFETKVLTPFESWKETSLVYRLHILESNITSGAKISWNDTQDITMNVGLSYEFNVNDTKFGVSCILESTIEDIKAIRAILNHQHGHKQFKTDITLQSSPNHMLSLLSSGKIVFNENSNDAMLSLTVVTPFLSIKTGEFICKLSLEKDRKLKGDVLVILDGSKYQAVLLGMIQNIRESKVLLKVLTPYEKFNLLKGRFGYSEKGKHFFAEVIGPTSALVLEVKYVFIDSSNFDLKLHISTPFAVLNDFIIVGLIDSENADFRCGWNSVVLGVLGSHHFNSWYDINYSLSLYTPIEGFKKNSAIFKIDYTDSLNLETRVLLPTMRVGLKALCEYRKPNISVAEFDEETFFDDEPFQKTDLFWKGAIAVDTLFYPTLTVELNITEHNMTYLAKSIVEFPNFNANISNKLIFTHLMGMSNVLQLQTSTATLSFAKCNYKVEGDFGRSMKSDLIIDAVSLNQTLQGSIGVEYSFNESKFDEDEGKELFEKGKYGLYGAQVNIRSPFHFMEYVKAVTFFEVDRNSFENNITVVTNFSKLFLEASLQSCEDFFESSVGINVTSKFIKFPYFKMLIKKDFTALDKKLKVNLILPSVITTKLDNYDVETLWRFEQNYLKLYGKVMTPFKNIDVLQGGVEYLYENLTHTYFVNSHFQRSSEVELKLDAKLYNKTLIINLESLIDYLRNVHFVGNLSKSGKQQSIEAVMVSDKTYKIVGWATTSENAPLSFEAKLMKNGKSEEEGSIILYVKKRNDGFEIDSMLQYEQKKVEFESKLKYHSPETRVVEILILSSHPDYKRFYINGLLFAKHFGQFVMTVKGQVESKWLNTSYNSQLKVWNEPERGALLSSFESPQLTSNSQFIWIWKTSETFYTSFHSYFLYNGLTQQFLSNVFFWNPNEDFKSVIMGSQINNNDNWILTANATILAPSSTNGGFLAYLQLPDNKELLHFMIGKFQILEKYNFVNHMLQYSTAPDNIKFQSFSEVQILKDEISGIILFQNKQNTPPFLQNSFKAKIVDNVYNVTNVLSSVLLNHDIVTNLLYKKPSSRHIVIMNLYHPMPNLIARANVDFESFDNVACIVNSSTPFPSIPHLAVDFKAITNLMNFERFLKILWKNSSVLFNMTHATEVRSISNLTNGVILVEFPVASQHKGKFLYGYEDSGEKVNGFSTLIFNNETIFDTKLSRETHISPTLHEDIISLFIDNHFVPIGIGYLGQHSEPYSKFSENFVSFKRAEIYKLHNRTAFNLTGEVLVRQNTSGRYDHFKLMNAKRSFVVESHYGKDLLYEYKTAFVLRNDLWASYELKLINKKIDWFGKTMELKMSYPRRNITLIGDLSVGNEYINSQVCVNSDAVYSIKTFGTALNWRRISSSPLHHQASLIISHPSFKKNVTLTGNYAQYNYSQADVKLILEYSLDRNKKLEITGNFVDNSTSNGTDYSLAVTGKHPVSRFKLDMVGFMILNSKVYDLAKNISYKRSYLPVQFWDAKALLDWQKNEIEFQRQSLRSVAFLKGVYNKLQSAHLFNISMAKDRDMKVAGFFYLNPKDRYTNLIVNFTPDELDRLYMEGSMEENRNIMLDIWRMYDDLMISDLKFYLTLNHSRLLSSALLWRPENHNEILSACYGFGSYLWDYVHETSEFWTSYIKSEMLDSVADVWFDAKPILQDFIDDISNLKAIQEDINHLKKQLNDSFNANEFYMKDIHSFYLVLAEEMSFRDQMNSLPKIFNELWDIMGETGQTIRKSILWLVETTKRIYEKFAETVRSLLRGDTLNQVSDFVTKLAIKYDKMIKDLHVAFVVYIERLWSETGVVMIEYWHKFLRNVEPVFIQVAHHLETVVWSTCKQIIEFIYEKKLELLNSTIFHKNSNLSVELDAFYKDLTKNNMAYNFKKYFSMLFHMLKEKYFSLVPFGYEINAIASEIFGELKELYKLPVVTFVVENSKKVYIQVLWFYDYFQINQKLHQAVPILYNKLNDYLCTSLDNEIINHKSRTKFIFDPENGVIELVQKLPMPWHAFNETPNFEYISEYRTAMNMQKFFAPSNTSFWSLYNKFAPYFDKSNWLPPFKAYAIIAGPRHFVTFDQTVYEFRGVCSYLLAHDFLNDEFSLVIQYDPTAQKNYYTLTLFTEGRTISIDLYRDALEIDDENINQMPIEMKNTTIYQEFDRIFIHSKKGFSLECNLKFDVCVLSLSGWFYGKTAGFLGTMDNEPSTDFMTINETIEKDVVTFSQSWAVAGDICLPMFSPGRKKYQPPQLIASCNALFQSKTSAFVSCFSVIDPHPYNEMCQRVISGAENEFCVSAVTYVQACSIQHTPLQIPSSCVKCDMLNDAVITEGDTINVLDSNIPQSSDIVLIIEAKECNKLITERKSLGSLLSALDKELNEAKLTLNRFAVVIFGGSGIYSKPRNLVINDNVFTESSATILPHIANIPTGNGSSDIYEALHFSSKLLFRPAVSKTFILFSCSLCSPSDMKLEYSVIHHALVDVGITLHLLMSQDFNLEKPKMNKLFYGLDAHTAYSKNDFKALKGDVDLKQLVRLSKSVLGYCIPLAFDTNGTLFTANKLESDNMNVVKKFVGVFAKRVAQTAKPSNCQSCECLADNYGIGRAKCFPCPNQKLLSQNGFDFKDELL